MKRRHSRLRQDRPGVDQRFGRDDIPDTGCRLRCDCDPNHAVVFGVPHGCAAEARLDQVAVTAQDLHPTIALSPLDVPFRPHARIMPGRKAEGAKWMVPEIARREQPFRCNTHRQRIDHFESGNVPTAIRLRWLPKHHARGERYSHALCDQRKIEPDGVGGYLSQVTAKVKGSGHDMRARHNIARCNEQPRSDHGFIAINAGERSFHALSHVCRSISVEPYNLPRSCRWQ